MDTAMIGKLEKAKFYAQEPERITFNHFRALFHGDNGTHTVTLSPEGWDCTSPGFKDMGISPHIMAMEMLFKPMLKRQPIPYGRGQNIVSDVDKAHRYAQETERIRFQEFEVTFHGDNNDHITRFESGTWHCDCEFFHSRGTCVHTMTMERLLGRMLVQAGV